MIITICGPSCAGKSTLEQILKARGFGSVVSTTTRPMRSGEVNGESYHFVSVSDFIDLIQSDGLVEHVKFGENYYGVSLGEITAHADSSIPKVIVCEPNGFRNIKNFCAKNEIPFFSVFIDGPPNIIAERFLSRVVDDVSSCANGVNAAWKLKTYATRLAEMMTTEREWGANVDEYDLYVESFVAENCYTIVDSIITTVKSKL